MPPNKNKGKGKGAGKSDEASTSGIQLSNAFGSLGEDGDSLPTIPDIPNVENLNETQRKLLLLQMAEKLRLSPDSLPDAAELPHNSLATATMPETEDAILANDSHAASAAAPKTAIGTFAKPSLTPSRKRSSTAATAAVDSKRQRMSTSGGEVEKVFLTGVKREFVKNGIIFKREFSKVMPNINLDQVIITQSGCVILCPTAPKDFSRLMKENWSKHVSFGNNLAVSLSRNKKVE